MRKWMKGAGIGVAAAGLALAASSGVSLGQSAAGVEPAERVAVQAKPAVVKVFAGCRVSYKWLKSGKVYEELEYGSGSGFFVSANGYAVTNAHVVEWVKDPASCEEEAFYEYVLDLAKDYNIDVRTLTAQEKTNLVTNARNGSTRTAFSTINIVRLSNGSDLPFEIKTYGAPVGEGKDVSVIKVETRNAPVLKLGDSEAVRLQEPLLAAGYPGAANSRVLSPESSLEATFTDGRVSARKTARDGAPILQISNVITYGNSGGPVLNMKGEVVGLGTFGGFNGNQAVNGISFAVASNTVAEFVRQAGTVNEEGAVDRAYREGLELYWNGKYTAAVSKFEEAKGLYPAHVEAGRYLQQAREAIAAGKEVKVATPVATASPSPVASATPVASPSPVVVEPKGEGAGVSGAVLPVGAVSLFAGAVGMMAVAGRRLVGRKRTAPLPTTTASGSFCGSCGGTVRASARFCPSCGTAQP